ncbi:MAG: hypothetical protein ACXW2G_05400, partial [Burkholderiaceae bacterium]
MFHPTYDKAKNQSETGSNATGRVAVRQQTKRGAEAPRFRHAKQSERMADAQLERRGVLARTGRPAGRV